MENIQWTYCMSRGQYGGYFTSMRNTKMAVKCHSYIVRPISVINSGWQHSSKFYPSFPEPGMYVPVQAFC